MCGIAGLVEREPQPGVLLAMTEAQAHRGPDDQGHDWVVGPDGWHVGLGSRRLAIIDLSSAGHQPMRAGEDLIVYNGEVYNFLELRSEVESRAPLRSGTDTEVVLGLLAERGVSALGRLNGMFGLAFWDASEGELLLARDRFGIKPLYYWLGPGGRLAFASELKALLHCGIPTSIDPAVLATYLSFGYVAGDASLLRGVRRLAPGHMLRWRRGKARIEPFRDTLPRPDPSMDEVEAAIELRNRARDSVRRQLVADVPVGVLLSGGLDSSSILGLAAAETSTPLRAYTIAFRAEDARLEQNPDDARYARAVAAHFGADLREFEVTPDVVARLPYVAWHLDEPIGDPAAILTLTICEAAADESTVLLSGQGADELFAGYRVNLYDRVAGVVANLPLSLRRVLGETADLFPALAKTAGIRPGLPLAAQRAMRTILDRVDLPREDRYVAMRNAYHFAWSDLCELLVPDVLEHVDPGDGWRAHRRAFAEAVGRPFFDRMLHVDVRTFLLDQNLAYTDRMSMAASIEMRVPYLDDAVADFALTIPERLKVRRLHGKHILRRAMEGVAPYEVIRRRKAGFGAPIRRWLQADLRGTVREVLSGGVIRERGLLRPEPVARLLEEHAAGAADHSYRIWTLLGLELWARSFLDRPVKIRSAAAPAPHPAPA